MKILILLLAFALHGYPTDCGCSSAQAMPIPGDTYRVAELPDVRPAVLELRYREGLAPADVPAVVGDATEAAFQMVADADSPAPELPPQPSLEVAFSSDEVKLAVQLLRMVLAGEAKPIALIVIALILAVWLLRFFGKKLPFGLGAKLTPFLDHPLVALGLPIVGGYVGAVGTGMAAGMTILEALSHGDLMKTATAIIGLAIGTYVATRKFKEAARMGKASAAEIDTNAEAADEHREEIGLPRIGPPP